MKMFKSKKRNLVMTESHIQVTNTVEHEDGSCTLTVDMDENTSKMMTSYGLKFSLMCAAYGITIDEAFERIAGK